MLSIFILCASVATIIALPTPLASPVPVEGIPTSVSTTSTGNVPIVDTAKFAEDVAKVESTVLNESKPNSNKAKGLLLQLLASTSRPNIYLYQEVKLDQVYKPSTNTHVEENERGPNRAD